ncbi:MAG TPA: amino acid racemase [Candidatus Sulfotelmatobacter sp.]|nr:amino acid racemase [Candidatus Sulfotelmatobacter sp.]
MYETKVVGVLGGMGPAATVDFYQKLIDATPAKADQDHLKVLIFSNPHVPDRTAAILTGGPSPLPVLITSAEVLARAGADFLVIPCVTAHHFHAALQQAISIPILHIVEETALEVLASDRAPGRIGLLATSGTLRTHLFENCFEPKGVTIVQPEAGIQEACVMPAIYGVKHGEGLQEPRRLVRQAALHLQDRGAEAIIAGCTEVPLILAANQIPIPLIDPTTILARAAVRRALADDTATSSGQASS